MDLKEFSGIDPGEHWYYKHKSTMIMRAIQKYGISSGPLVDVGSGSGFFAQEAKRRFQIDKIYCVDPNYSQEQIGKLDGINYQTEAPKHSANLYLFIDVLEHVKDDRALLSSYIGQASQSALFLLSVPAFMALWSPHDVFLGHERRYKLREIEKVARDCGLEIVHARYLFGPIFPLVYIFRKFRRNSKPSSDLGRTSGKVGAILLKILWFETLVEQNRICGTSAFVVAKVRKVVE